MTPGGLTDMWGQAVSRIDAVETENQALIEKLDKQLDSLRGKKGKGFTEARKRIKATRDRLLQETGNLSETAGRQFSQAIMGAAIERAMADGVTDEQVGSFIRQFSAGVQPGKAEGNFTIEDVYQSVIKGLKASSEEASSRSDSVINADVSDDSVVADDDAGTPPAPPGKPPVTTGAPAAPAGGSDGNGGSGNKNSGSDNENDRNGNDGVPEEPSDKDQDQAFEVAMAQAEEMAREANEKGPVAGQGVENRDEVRVTLEDIENRFRESTPGLTDEQYRQIALTADRHPISGIAGKASKHTFIDAVAKTLKKGQAMILYEIDLDWFKAINDSLGHSAGDQVMQHAQRLLRDLLKGFEIMHYHYGGDEGGGAMVVSDGKEAISQAIQAFKAARDAVNNLQFYAPNGKIMRVSMSMGVSMIGSGVSADSVLIAGKETQQKNSIFIDKSLKDNYDLDNDIGHDYTSDYAPNGVLPGKRPGDANDQNTSDNSDPGGNPPGQDNSGGGSGRGTGDDAGGTASGPGDRSAVAPGGSDPSIQSSTPQEDQEVAPPSSDPDGPSSKPTNDAASQTDSTRAATSDDLDSAKGKPPGKIPRENTQETISPEELVLSEGQVGKSGTVYLPDNTPVGFTYALVDLWDLILSNNNDFTPNSDFPEELQPRGRDREAMRVQVIQMSENLVPEKLGASPSVGSGAPIVGPDGVVESGNGRAMAIRRAYDTANADGYASWLIDNADEFGIDGEELDAMEMPVLVRVRSTGVSNRNEFVRQANEGEVAAMSPLEQAESDALMLDETDMSIFAPSEEGQINIAANRPFIVKFLNKLGIAARAEYVTADGEYTRQLVDRVEAAVFHKAYVNRALTELVAESTDPEIKNILKGMLVAAGKFAKVRNLAEARNGIETLDNIGIIRDLTDAVEFIRMAKKEHNMAISKAVNNKRTQGDLFSIPLTKSADLAVDAMVEMIRSGKRQGEFFSNLADALKKYLDDVLNYGNDLTGETPEFNSLEEIRNARRKASGPQIDPDPDPLMGYARRDNKSDGEDQPGSSERSAAYHTQETDGALVNEPPPARKPEQLEFDFAFSTQEAESQPAQARRSGELIASQTTLISTTGYIHAANTRLDGDGDAASLISHIRRYAQENAYLIIVDADGNVLEVFHHTKGLKASSQIDSTDLAGHVFNVPGAAKVYFVHNHPSGHTEPSENDMMIADGIQLTLDARGIKMSSLILGGTEYTTFSPVGYGMARKIRPVLRKIKVPKKEKTRIVLHGPQQLKQANSPREAMAIIVDDYGNQDGILLLDSKNQAVGFLTMPTGMPVAEAVSEVVAAACITNARAMVFNSNEPMSYGSRQAFATGLVQGFHESWQLTLFDVFEKGRSLADQNRLPQVPPRDAPRVLNKEAVGGKTLYTTETGNTDAITTDQAMDAFSRFNPDEIYEENGNIILRKSGRELVVEMADNIDLDEGEFMAGYRRAPKPGEEAQGEYTPGRIRLKKGKADKWVLDHESFHWLREAGFISNKDYLALKKGAKAAYGINNLADVTEEDVANFVADKLESRDLAGHNKGLASALQKIFDLVDGFINLMGYRTAGGVVRDIESGAIADKADMDHGDDLSARVTVYHGTNKDIDVNDLSPEFTGQNINGSTQAKGIYFSNHKDTAEGYAEYEQITGGSEKLGKILETIINTDNLKVIKTNDIITEKQAAPIREQGYDGVWKQGIDGSAGHDEFILFNKKPIAADKKYSTGQPDPRLAPAKKTMADSLRDALKALDPRVAWQKYAGDPIWKFFSETGPEAVGRKIEFIDKINRGIITDYRLDDEFIALRDETEQMIRQAREKAKELARIIATFPRAEQIRIGQVIEGSITNMPKRYEAALKVAEEFKRLEGDLQDLGLLGQDHRFRQLTRKEIAGKFDEIAELERQIVKLQNQLKPHIEVTRARGRRVAEAISEIVTEDVIEDSKSGGNVETRLHRAVQLNEERVKEALLHRGFSDGEADQMIRRVKESVIAPAEDTPSAASSSTTEIRKTIVKTIERKVIETITEQKTKTYSKTVMARARGSIVKEINQLRKKQAEILSRIQTHYKMSGKQYLRLAYDTEKSESAFLASLRHYAKNARLKKGYSHQRKELDPEWRWNHRKATPELVMKGLSEETHDVELMRMFSAIAGNDKWAVPANMWNAYMDDDPATYGNFKPMSPSDKLGPLAGMMVDPYIYDYLNATIDQRNELGRMYDELLRLWKTGKVVYNPASQCRNIMSGIILADMGDLSPHRLDIYAKAAAALKTQNDVYKAAYKHGALGTEWAGHEIKSFLEEAERLNQGEGSMLSNSVRLIKRLADMPGRSYQGIEQFFKLAMFIDQREKGATDKQAAAHALKWCFDYTKIPSGIKWAKRWYSPFITFTYKAMPRMAETAVRKPWKMAKYAMLFYAVEALTRRLRGESEEEEDREKRVLPDYMRRTTLPGMPSHLRVPITDKYGRSKYLDLSYILPWGDIGEMWGQSRIKAVPRAFLPSHPLYVTVAEVGFDTIMFTGQPLTKEWMNTGDYSKELGKEVWRQAMPSLAGSYSWNKLMAAAKGEKDWAGRDRSFPEAVFDVFLGVKLRSVDYHEQLEWRMKEKREAIQQLEHDFTREYRRIHIQAPSNDLEKQREREREMYEKFGERTDAILEQITEIIE
jgi:diguanylate cyclase (GGDEF)-like protein